MFLYLVVIIPHDGETKKILIQALDPDPYRRRYVDKTKIAELRGSSLNYVPLDSYMGHFIVGKNKSVTKKPIKPPRYILTLNEIVLFRSQRSWPNPNTGSKEFNEAIKVPKLVADMDIPTKPKKTPQQSIIDFCSTYKSKKIYVQYFGPPRRLRHPLQFITTGQGYKWAFVNGNGEGIVDYEEYSRLKKKKHEIAHVTERDIRICR